MCHFDFRQNDGFVFARQYGVVVTLTNSADNSRTDRWHFLRYNYVVVNLYSFGMYCFTTYF